MKNRPRRTVAENVAARIERNQRKADETRAFLSKLAPTRERERNEENTHENVTNTKA